MYTLSHGHAETPNPPRAYRVRPRCTYAHPQAWLRTPKLRDFRVLYTLVTSDLRAYLHDAQPAFTARERCWFRFLVFGFLCSFHQWPDQKFARYFGILDDPRADDRFRLAGYVFLHIAYDLPRTIATSFTPECVAAPADLVERSTCRLRFLGAAPRFGNVMRSFLARRHRFLHYVTRNRAGRAFATLMTQWVVALRTTAWVHGELLFDDETQRDARIDRLLGALERAAHDSLQDGLFGIPRLGVELRALPLMWLIPEWVPRALMSVAGLTVVAIELLRWRRDQRTSRDESASNEGDSLARINRFGHLVLQYTSDAMMTPQEEPLG